MSRFAASLDFLLDLSLSVVASALYGRTIFDSFTSRTKRNAKRRCSHN